MRLINLFGCLIYILLGACAAPVITSDQIMFPGKKQSKEKIKFLGVSSIITVELPSYHDELIKQSDLNKHDEFSLDENIENIISAGLLNLSFMKLNFSNNNFTFGLSFQTPFLGPNAIEATVKVLDSYYISGGVFNNGYSGIVQKRLHWDGIKGSSIGIYGHYRQHLFLFFPNSGFIWINNGIGESSFIGIRYKYFIAGGQAKYFRGEQNESYMITLGYNPEFKTIAVRLGYTF
jgi:hypothetical protein